MPIIEPIQSKFDLKVLNSEQLAQIKAATLHVLENVGVRFPSEKALNKFAEHGAIVDGDTQVVKLRADFVLEAMSQAPRSYVLSGRTPGTDLNLGSGNSYFATDGCGVETIDFESGEPRPSCKDDVARMARVADYLSFDRLLLAHGQRPGLWSPSTTARTGCDLQQFGEACANRDRDGSRPGRICG